jgi:hypothetical protein
MGPEGLVAQGKSCDTVIQAIGTSGVGGERNWKASVFNWCNFVCRRYDGWVLSLMPPCLETLEATSI